MSFLIPVPFALIVAWFQWRFYYDDGMRVLTTLFVFSCAYYYATKDDPEWIRRLAESRAEIAAELQEADQATGTEPASRQAGPSQAV